jgi:ribosomal protein S18
MIEPVQPINLDTPISPVSENFQYVLQALSDYKKKINTKDTLNDNDPISVSQLKKRLLEDSRILKQFVNNHKRIHYKRPQGLSKDLQDCLEKISEAIDPAQKENILSAISFMFEQYPFTPNIEHTLRQIYTDSIDTNDGDSYEEDEEDEEGEERET